MQERIKQIPVRLLEIWKKYSKKQKAIILSVVGGVVILLVLLIFLLGRTEYVELGKFDDVSLASQAVNLLKDAGIPYTIDSDNVTIRVDEKRKTEAVYLIEDSELKHKAKFSIGQLLESDMSTTNFDKQLRLHLYFQSDIEELLERQEGIDKASISYLPSDTRTSILETNKEIGCSVFLTINNKFKRSSAEAIAITIANSIGNASTDKIKVIDQYGNLLYNGPKNEESGYASATLEFTKEIDAYYNDLVTRFALMNGFDFVEPSFHLDINFDKKTEEFREYLAAEGQEQGLFQAWSKITSENQGASGNIPGTDSNDDVDYYLQENGSGNSSYEEINITYAPSERLTKTVSAWGVVNNQNSSVAIALKKVKDVTEEELNTLGLLGDMSYEEYIIRNSEPVEAEVNPEWYTFFSHVTGIPQNNISVKIYEVTNFIETPDAKTDWSFILKAILTAMIVGLLIFVVFRGMSPVQVTEIEPELSVEQLLATTKENQSLDDIEFSEKSETKRMIEKFVDENPEAVANLLRNWLQDEWK